jgi:ubiquitin fusion degradation protein 1
MLQHLNFAVIMLLSAFDQLGGLKIEYSMLFQIKNPSTERDTRCSVLEFVANEGFIHMPSWVFTNCLSNTIPYS